MKRTMENDLLELLKLVKRPGKSLFFKSHDSIDERMGELACSEPEHYRNARFVILSCSQDIGVERNHGRTGTAGAPCEIRKQFYRLSAPRLLKKGDIFDLGDTYCEGSLEKVHERHLSVLRRLLEDDKTPIVLGGGNDLSYPDVKAFAEKLDSCAVFNIDAHLDIRRSDRRNSGTPYRQLIEEKIINPERLFETAFQSQANAARYLQDARDWKIGMIPLENILVSSVTDCLNKSLESVTDEGVFIGFDMDSVRSSDAPGVSAPSPIGLTSEQAVSAVRYLAGRFRNRMLEITEVNPRFDIDTRTAKLAAILIHAFIDASMAGLAVR